MRSVSWVFLYWNRRLASWCFSERFLPPLLTLSACLRNTLFKIWGGVFCCPIGRWMVRRCQCLFNSILFKEIYEFLGNELGSVVQDNFFWQSICHKPQSLLINSALSNMHSLPHPSRPSPWVQWCTRGCVLHCLTNFAILPVNSVSAFKFCHQI